MTSSQARLDRLPEELLVTILENIVDLPSLASLSTATRHLRRLTLPFLYHRFPGRNSELFLRTVSHAPDLARHTTEAVWHQERKTVPRIDMLEKRYIVTRLNELAVPHGTDLSLQFNKFGKSDDYWYFEVLMLFLPNLQRIEVKESWLWDDHHYWFKSASPFFNPLCGSRLTSVTLFGPMRIENAVPLLMIPSLRSLELTQVTVMRREGFKVFQWSLWPVERILLERSSGLEVLALKNSFIELDTLLPILRGIRALKEFTYEHVPNDLVDAAARILRISMASLMRCLNTHNASLQSVRIRDSVAFEWSITNELFGPTTPSSEDSEYDEYRLFPNLHTLDIGPFESVDLPPEDDLYGFVDHLPQSLKTLGIQIHDGIFSKEDIILRDIGNRIGSTRPDLKLVELLDWDPIKGWYPNALPLLQVVYTGFDMQLVAIPHNVLDIYGAEPLLVDEETEPGWVLVTDLKLSKA